jgi:hypothetical protein
MINGRLVLQDANPIRGLMQMPGNMTVPIDRGRILKPALPDFLIALFVVTLSVAGFLNLNHTAALNQALVRVYIDNHLQNTFPLVNSRVLDLGHMKIQCTDGSVRVISSDCPRGLCRHHHEIKAPGDTIICVPNRTLIEISGGPESSRALDAVTR